LKSVWLLWLTPEDDDESRLGERKFVGVD